MQQSLLILSVTTTILTMSLLVLAVSNQRLLRAERRRSAARAETDRGLIEAHEANAAAQKMRGDAAEELAMIQQETIGLLRQRIDMLEGHHPVVQQPHVVH